MMDIREELVREQEQRSRLIDLIIERQYDEIRGVSKSIMVHALIEMNVRIRQYVQQFQPYSLDFLIVQTLQDFKREIVLLQNEKELNKREAVAKWNNQYIYVDEFVMKSDFNDGGIEIFTFKEPMT